MQQVWEAMYIWSVKLSTYLVKSDSASDPALRFPATAVISALNGRPIPKGGSGMLSVALGRYLEANNAVVLTRKPVVRLMIEGGRCTGVECLDGSQYRGRKGVVSTIHPKNLIAMAPRELWGEALLDTVDIWQPEHAMLAFHFAPP